MKAKNIEKIIKESYNDLDSIIIIGYIEMLEKQIRAFGAEPWSNVED